MSGPREPVHSRIQTVCVHALVGSGDWRRAAPLAEAPYEPVAVIVAQWPRNCALRNAWLGLRGAPSGTARSALGDPRQ